MGVDLRQRVMRALRRVRRAYLVGLVGCIVLRLMGWSAVVLLAYAAADLFLAFSPSSRVLLNVVLLIGLGVATLVLGIRLLRVSLAQMAQGIDRAGDDRRHTVLTALELTQESGSDHVLWGYLVGTAAEQALARLRALPARVRYPVDQLKQALWRTLLQVVVTLAILGGGFAVSQTVLARIFHPHRDIPPYSRYVFHVTPAVPKVLYGGGIEVHADITGGAIRSSVWLRTRAYGRERKAACFQLDEGSYAQRMEQVVEPLEFCFQVGRARSHWQRVELMLEPRVVLARLSVTPPVYSRRAPYGFFAGDMALEDLVGSRVGLDITSNRPLAGGRLRVLTEGADDENRVVGMVVTPHVVRFEWSIESAASLEIMLEDIRGTWSQEAFRLEQTTVLDAPPEVALTQPRKFSLATPTTSIIVAGYAHDDLGLRTVDLVQGLVGYRDRARPQGPTGDSAHLDLKTAVELAELGVEPGQTLEFYLEALDSNPTMTGVGASDVAQVRIISDDEYAEIVRARTRTEEFLARFRVAKEASKRFEDALEALDEALKDPQQSAAERESRLEALRREMEEAQKLLQQLAEDFPVFDAEQGLRAAAGAYAETLEQFHKELRGVKAEERRCQLIVDGMKKRFSEKSEALARETRNAEEIAKVSRLMELTMAYQQLVLRQERLVRRLDRYANPSEIRDAGLFRLAAREERAVHDRLLELQKEIRIRAGELPEGMQNMRQSAMAFADAIDTVEAPQALADARVAAENQEGHRTQQQATLALERMRSLLSNCQGSFGEMGRCEKFSVPDPRMGATLAQMMAAWKSGTGRGGEGGMGGGTKGSGESGYSMPGMSPLNVDLYGPSRMEFRQPGVGGAGGGGGQGAAGDAIVPENARESLAPGAPLKFERETLQLEQVPEKYRDAVRRYFGREES